MADAAEIWFEQNDPEGVAFEYKVLERTASVCVPELTPNADIKLNTRVALRPISAGLAWLQVAQTGRSPAWPAYCAIRGHFMKIGSIEFNGRTTACLIRNQSETGAALEVVSPVGIPGQFTLLIAAQRVRCTVIWRTEKLIGVKFHRV